MYEYEIYLRTYSNYALLAKIPNLKDALLFMGAYMSNNGEKYRKEFLSHNMDILLRQKEKVE